MDKLREKLMGLIDIGSGCPDGMNPFGDSCESCRYKESTMCHLERLADHLLANGVTVQSNELITNCHQLWIPASEPPTEYRDEYGELIPFLVCLDGTEYPFRAMYDGKVWGDGWGAIPVTHWMPLPEPPKEG